MIGDYRVLVIIPARGGSKGLPRKNIKKLAGIPLVAWPINTAKKSKYVDAVVVSTDDEEISLIAKNYGAEIPFIRPENIADDQAKSSDVICHAINYIENKENRFFDIVILLEPTSPLTDALDLDSSLERLIKSKAKSLVGVGKVEDQHPCFCVELSASDFIKPYDSLTFLSPVRRQDIEPLYFFDGSIYISFVSSYKKNMTFYHSETIAYEFPKWKNIEIDDLCDFLFIETICKNISSFRQGC